MTCFLLLLCSEIQTAVFWISGHSRVYSLCQGHQTRPVAAQETSGRSAKQSPRRILPEGLEDPPEGQSTHTQPDVENSLQFISSHKVRMQTLITISYKCVRRLNVLSKIIPLFLTKTKWVCEQTVLFIKNNIDGRNKLSCSVTVCPSKVLFSLLQPPER